MKNQRPELFGFGSVQSDKRDDLDEGYIPVTRYFSRRLGVFFDAFGTHRGVRFFVFWSQERLSLRNRYDRMICHKGHIYRAGKLIKKGLSELDNPLNRCEPYVLQLA